MPIASVLLGGVILTLTFDLAFKNLGRIVLFFSLILSKANACEILFGNLTLHLYIYTYHENYAQVSRFTLMLVLFFICSALSIWWGYASTVPNKNFQNAK